MEIIQTNELLNDEPFVPDIDYNDDQDVQFLRKNLDVRYKQLQDLMEYKRPTTTKKYEQTYSNGNDTGNQKNFLNTTTASKLGSRYWDVESKKRWKKSMHKNQIIRQNIIDDLTENQFKNQTTLAPFLQTFLQRKLIYNEPSENDALNSEIYNEKVQKIKLLSNRMDQIDKDVSNSFNLEQSKIQGDNHDLQEKIKNQTFYSVRKSNDTNFKRSKTSNLSSRKSKENNNQSIQKQLQLEDIEQFSQQKDSVQGKLVSQRAQHIENSEIYIRNAPVFNVDPENSILIDMEKQFQSPNLGNIQSNIQNNKKFFQTEEKENKQLSVEQKIIQYQKPLSYRKKVIIPENNVKDFRKTYKESFYLVQNKDPEELKQKEQLNISVKQPSQPKKDNRSVSVDKDYFLVSSLRPSGKEIAPNKKQKKYLNYEDFYIQQLKQNTPLYLNKTNRLQENDPIMYKDEEYEYRVQRYGANKDRSKENSLYDEDTSSEKSVDLHLENMNISKFSSIQPTQQQQKLTLLQSQKLKHRNLIGDHKERRHKRKDSEYHSHQFFDPQNPKNLKQQERLKKFKASQLIKENQIKNKNLEQSQKIAKKYRSNTVMQRNYQKKEEKQAQENNLQRKLYHKQYQQQHNMAMQNNNHDIFENNQKSIFKIDKLERKKNFKLLSVDNKENGRGMQARKNIVLKQYESPRISPGKQVAFMYTTGQGHLDYAKKSQLKNQNFSFY